MKPKRVRLPPGRVWLRLAQPAWKDPLDASYARMHGGRWNPPGSYPVLYLNADVVTARLQIERLLAGSPVTVDDLDDSAYLLVAVTLPRAQTAADAVNADGLRALGLPESYPQDASGAEVGQEICQPIGRRVHELGLRGVWCRSACTNDGRGRELAWFPARRTGARPVRVAALPLGAWRYARSWSDIGLGDQPAPSHS